MKAIVIIITITFSPLMVTTFSLALGAACSTLMTICTPYWYIIFMMAMMMVILMMMISISVIGPHLMSKEMLYQVVCCCLCHVWLLPFSLVCFTSFI